MRYHLTDFSSIFKLFEFKHWSWLILSSSIISFHSSRNKTEASASKTKKERINDWMKTSKQSVIFCQNSVCLINVRSGWREHCNNALFISLHIFCFIGFIWLIDVIGFQVSLVPFVLWVLFFRSLICFNCCQAQPPASSQAKLEGWVSLNFR